MFNSSERIAFCKDSLKVRPIAITSPDQTFDITANASHNVFAFQNQTGVTLTSLTLDLFGANIELLFSCGDFAGDDIFSTCSSHPGSGTDTTLVSAIGCEHDVDYGTTYDFGDAASTFTLATGESFKVSSTHFEDHDDADCGLHTLDDDMGSFTQDFTYPVAAGSQTFQTSGGDDDTHCALQVNATISIE
jgi:hypothetical protein